MLLLPGDVPDRGDYAAIGEAAPLPAEGTFNTETLRKKSSNKKISLKKFHFLLWLSPPGATAPGMTRQNEPLSSMLSAKISLSEFQCGNPQMFVAWSYVDSEPDALGLRPRSPARAGPHPFPQRSPGGDSRLSAKRPNSHKRRPPTVAPYALSSTSRTFSRRLSLTIGFAMKSNVLSSMPLSRTMSRV